MKILSTVGIFAGCIAVAALMSMNIDAQIDRRLDQLESQEPYLIVDSIECPAPAPVAVVTPVVAASVPSDIPGLSRGILEVLKADPKRDLNTDEAKRLKLAAALSEIGDDYSIDPFLLLAMAFKEGSLRTDVVGKLGEVSTMQVHGVAERKCKKEGFVLTSLHGQIECGAFYLSTLIEDCGGLRCGLSGYASGSYDGNKAVQEVVNSRLALAAELRSLK